MAQDRPDTPRDGRRGCRGESNPPSVCLRKSRRLEEPGKPQAPRKAAPRTPSRSWVHALRQDKARPNRGQDRGQARGTHEKAGRNPGLGELLENRKISPSCRKHGLGGTNSRGCEDSTHSRKCPRGWGGACGGKGSSIARCDSYSTLRGPSGVGWGLPPIPSWVAGGFSSSASPRKSPGGLVVQGNSPKQFRQL